MGFRNWLRRWTNRPQQIARRVQKARRARPMCEILEDRTLMTVTVNFSSGILTFTGDAAGDTVLLQSTTTPSTVLYNAGGLGLTSQPGVTQLVYNGNGGADQLIVGNIDTSSVARIIAPV